MTQVPESLTNHVKQLQASATEFLEAIAPLLSISEAPTGASPVDSHE